jgi:hypothetical protein
MNASDARIMADRYLAQMLATSPVDIAFNYEITEEHPLGYVFFYNSKKFWQTRDYAFSLAGNGPLLVKRATGEVIVLASHQSVMKSLREISEGSV